MRLSESSRARTKDNSHSCTIPCRCYYRWALSGTGEAVVAVKSDGAKLKFVVSRASRDRDYSRFYRTKKEREREKKRAKMIQPSHCIIFEGFSLPANCILDFFRSHASHNFSSVRSRSCFSLFLPFSLPLCFIQHPYTHTRNLILLVLIVLIRAPAFHNLDHVYYIIISVNKCFFP